MPPVPGEQVPLRSTPLLAAWLYFCAYTIWAIAMLAGLVDRAVANDLLFLPLYFGAGLAGLRAGRIHAGSPRIGRGWRLVGVAWLSSGVAAALMTAAWVWPVEPLNWVPTFLYQLYFPLLLVGIWHLIEIPAVRTARVRLVVEGLVVVVATAILAWYFIFRLDEASRALLPYLKTLLFMFPGEMAVALGATLVVHRPAPAGEARSLTLFSVGTLAAVVADFVYGHDVLVKSDLCGPLGDLLLAVAAILVLTAGLTTRGRPDPVRPPAVRASLTLVPYLAILVVGAILAVEWRQPGLPRSPLGGLVLGGAILMGLLIVQLIVVQREFVREASARATQDARFRSLVQCSSDAILVVDRNGTILYASPPFSVMLGCPSADLTGHALTDYVNFDPPRDARSWLAGPSVEPVVRWKVGSRDVEVAGTDLTGDPLIGGIVINARDISERTQLEARLRQAQKLEAVGRLASSVAHDFNNILTVITGSLRLAQISEGDELSEELEHVEAAAERGAALARQLLGLSRPKVATARTVDLRATLLAMEKTLRVLLPASIEVVVRPGPVALTVGMDEVQVEQILLNLAINSRDAMPRGGTLEIGVELVDRPDPAIEQAGEHRWARIVVRDTGCGMSEEVLANALEPFFTTKDPGLGTGLGLSSARAIVTEAGGRVELESQPELGTTVTILIPLAASVPDHSAGDATLTRHSGQGRLLVVDDEASVRHLLVRYFERLGYQITEREDGLAALEYLESHPQAVDLLLTDLVMPRMGGQELVERVRARWPRLPVLCMSGTPAALGEGPEPWTSERVIAKPAELSEVGARVAAALGASDDQTLN